MTCSAPNSLERTPNVTGVGCRTISEKQSRLAFEQMNEMRHNEQLTDVVLVVGADRSKRIIAHRLVLAASSSYFRAMFTSSMTECRQRKLNSNNFESP